MCVMINDSKLKKTWRKSKKNSLENPGHTPLKKKNFFFNPGPTPPKRFPKIF